MSDISLTNLRSEIASFKDSNPKGSLWPKSLRNKIVAYTNKNRSVRSMTKIAKELGVEVKLLYNWSQINCDTDDTDSRVLEVIENQELIFEYNTPRLSFTLRVN